MSGNTMAQATRGPDDVRPNRHGAAREDKARRADSHGGEGIEDVRRQVARQEYPRRRVVRRGRALLVAYCAVLAIVVALALAAHAMSVLPGDLPFTRELQETSNPFVAGLMTFISFIGFPVQSAVLLVIAVVILLALRLPLEAAFLVVCLLADALGALLKAVIGRQRPSPSLVHVVQHFTNPSFPSGHTLHYTVFYGFLIFIVATTFKPSWGRTVAIVLLAIPIALVGLSRVYLGEHWASDVVGGYLIGALCLVPLIGGYLWVKARYTITGHSPFLHRRPRPDA